MAALTLLDARAIRRMSQEQLIYWQLRLTRILELRAKFLETSPKIDPSYKGYLTRTSSSYRTTIMLLLAETQRREDLLDPAYDCRASCRT